MADDIRMGQIIFSLNPNFTNLGIDNKANKVIDWGDNTPISDEDINAERVRLQTEFDNDLTKQAADKASANQKLKDLGLTDDEIKAIKGIS